MKGHCPASPSRFRGDRRAQGFTLLEIIVVVLVFAVMAAMAYGGLNSVLKMRRGIEDSMQRTADLQRAFMRLRQDFQNVRDRPARNQFGEPEAPLAIDRDQVLTLIRGGLRNPLGGSRSSMERVRYRVQDRKLMRATWTALDLPDKAEPFELAVLKDVEEVRWRFLDTGYTWQSQWPETPQGNSLSGNAAEPPPLAVEVTVVTKDWGEMRFLFRTTLAGLVSGGGGEASNGAATAPGLITSEGLLPSSALSASGTPRGERDLTDPDEAPPTEEPPTPDPTPDPPEDPGIPSTESDP